MVRGERGFTLLEVLVAVAITASVAAALYGVFVPMLNTQQRVDQEVEKLRELRRFFDIFSMEIRSAYTSATNPITIFIGEKSIVGGEAASSIIELTTFTYPLLGTGRPGSDLKRVRYRLTQDEPGRKVFYKEQWNPYTSRVAEATKAEVVEGVESFTLEYHNGLEWAGAWDSSMENRLPAAVRVVLILEDDPGIEYSMIARPQFNN